ncbi:hypothetical protein GGR50DRAFT_696380 [Xylaria sp. CBS 124048]|nr:hypothetical protein GGR50DRAFT_696380 [Xylaria sp. CBS 124048]
MFDVANLDQVCRDGTVNAGQVCVTANRVSVQRGVYEKTSRKGRPKQPVSFRVGYGPDEGPMLGAVIVRRISLETMDKSRRGR